MLGKRQAKKFIEDNKDALIFLCQKIQSLEKGRNTKYAKYQQDVRWLAVDVIEECITEVFGIAYDEFADKISFESDNLIKRLDENRREVDATENNF